MQSQSRSVVKTYLLFALVIMAAASLSLNFLMTTPPGWYAKGMAIGASVCHQIPSHSFLHDDLQFPMCARCSGLYLGSFIGLLYFASQGRKSALPKRGILLLLCLLTLMWGTDGLNSLISDILKRPFLYPTNNTTRLASGFGMGLVLSTALATLFNVTIWKKREDSALLRNLWQVGAYMVLAAGMSALLVFSNECIFQALAFISIGMVVIVISLLYTIFWIIVAKKENSFDQPSAAGLFFCAGFASAMAQISLLSLLRGWLL